MASGKINRFSRWIQYLVVVIALSLRLVVFPHHDEIRGFDEAGYLTGSLALLEGLPPGYKAAPAGPNTWVGWFYAGFTAVWYEVHPGLEEKSVPAAVRPFVAVNHALFDQYRDLSHLHDVWIITQLLLSLWAVFAAFRFGYHRAGPTGGILIGGLIAALPLYVDYSMMSRPYMTAWSFAILSLNAATTRKPGKRAFVAAVFMGLSIASRIEMLLFVPVVAWEFLFKPDPRPFAAMLRFIGVTTVTLLLAAPWFIVHLFGNLRTIATVRLGGANLEGASTFAGLLKEMAWSRQGLIGVLIGFCLVLIVLLIPGRNLSWTEDAGRPGERSRLTLLTMYVALLLASLIHGPVLLHQQGAVVLGLITFSAFAAAVVDRITPTFAPVVAILVFLMPALRTIQLIHHSREIYSADGSIDWVETHVPAGTIVYLQPGLQNLLPTAESSTALWREVTDAAAGARKFQSGMERFGLSAGQMPRALDDENMIQERGNRRGLYILGSGTQLIAPRFDIRVYDSSPVFGVHDVAAAFARTGGVVISQNSRGIPQLGEPVAKWVSPSGVGSFVYCSSELLLRLRPVRPDQPRLK